MTAAECKVARSMSAAQLVRLERALLALAQLEAAMAAADRRAR